MHAVALTSWLLVHLAVLLLPGIAVASLTPTFRRADNSMVLPIVMTACGLMWLASFFASWIAPGLGRTFTVVVALSAAGLLARTKGRSFVASLVRDRDVRTPFLLSIALAIAFTGALTLYGGYAHVASIANERFLPGKPPDNILPGILADRVTDGTPTDPFWGDWLSSDRPPLQAGAVSFVRPLSTRAMSEIRYQTTGTVLQLLIVPALWALLRSLGVARRLVLPAVLAASLSGTMLLYSTYVWPKLLSAALCLVAVQVLVQRGPPVVAGMALSLGFLAHGGALFVAVPLVLALSAAGVAALVSRDSGTRRARFGSVVGSLAVLLVAALTVYAPWAAYQRWVAPPGNRLLKWHLAGATAIDNRSVTESLIDAYTAPSLAELAELKRQNVEFLVAPGRFAADFVPVAGGWTAMRNVRDREFSRLASAIGPAWLGLPLTVLGVLRRRIHRHRASRRIARPPDEEHGLDVAAVLLGSCVVTVAIWCVLMYGPQTTLVHQGTMTVPLMAMAALALAAGVLHRIAAWAVVVATVWHTARVWVLSGPPSPGLSLSGAGVAMLTAGTFAIAVVAVAGIAGAGIAGARIAGNEGARIAGNDAVTD